MSETFIPKRSVLAFFAAAKRSFDKDPHAKFLAGEKDGLTLVIARGAKAAELQDFVTGVWHGRIDRPEPGPDDASAKAAAI